MDVTKNSMFSKFILKFVNYTCEVESFCRYTILNVVKFVYGHKMETEDELLTLMMTAVALIVIASMRYKSGRKRRCRIIGYKNELQNMEC